MTASITFDVPGEPRGKGRPRATTFNGKTRMFTDSKTASYENLIAIAAKAAMGSLEPFEGPVALHMQAWLQLPSTGSRKRLAAMLSGESRPAKKPDTANILCAIQDGMNQIVYRDDKQVVQITASKHWSSTPGVTVTVSEILP